MKQAWHIVRKDIRYLWPELSLLLAADALYAWWETHIPNPFSTILVCAASSFFIARLIHAETIPGDRQFWLTRPYRWQSLLAAKLISIVLFVNAPLLIARLYVINELGFPWANSLPGLLWSQLLMLLCAALPIAAFATMLPGTLSFMLSVLTLFVVGFFTGPLLVMFQVQLLNWPTAIRWIRGAVLLFGLVAGAIPILYLQYRKRSSALSRTFAVAILIITMTVHWNLPIPFGLTVQSWLSPEFYDTSQLEIRLDPSEKTFRTLMDRQGIPIALPLVMRGFPLGVEVQADYLTAEFEGVSGSWDTDVMVVSNRPNGSEIPFMGALMMDAGFFNAEQDNSVKLRGEFYFTVFGNPREQTIPVARRAVDVMDGIRCLRGQFDFFECRSPLRWPSKLVALSTPGSRGRNLWSDISYSPFPGELSFYNFDVHGVSGLSPATEEVTISIREPISHFRWPFEIPDVHLAELRRVTR